MKDSGYYPPGAANDPNAPYNEVSIPERNFGVCISQTLSKSTIVTTNDYIPGEEGVDYESDGEGGCVAFGWRDPDDTSDTDWENAYKEEHLTPLELIEKFKELLTNHLPDPVVDIKKYKEWKHLISECENWIEDDLEIIQE